MKSVTISWDYDKYPRENHLDAAAVLLKKADPGWKHKRTDMVSWREGWFMSFCCVY